MPALATGNNEIAPMDMANAFSAVADLGVHHDPYYIESIQDPTGKAMEPSPRLIIGTQKTAPKNRRNSWGRMLRKGVKRKVKEERAFGPPQDETG